MLPSFGIRVDVIVILSNLLSYCIISSADKCIPVTGSTCKCAFNDGRIIDLIPISPEGKALFSDKSATGPWNDTSKYSYNPCFDFKEGDNGCSGGVTVCQKDGKNEYPLGSVRTSRLIYKEERNELFLIYNENHKETNVTLICSSAATQPKLVVLGESKPGSSQRYFMKLTTKCACPNGCIEKHGLSTGSVLVVLFFVFAAVYFFGGMTYLKFVGGASGTEIIPNYDFWIDFPLLVRDGVIFLLNCCRAETTYERI